MYEWKRSDYKPGMLVKYTESNWVEYRNAIGNVLAIKDEGFDDFKLLVGFAGKSSLWLHPSKVEITASMDMIAAPCELVPVTRKRKRLGDIRRKG